MSELFNNSGFVALLGTIFGGVGLKMIEHWLGRAKERAAEQQGIRDELRKEIDSLRNQLIQAEKDEEKLETKLDEWKTKWFDLREEKQQAVTDLAILKAELESAKKRLEKWDRLENRLDK